jgi:hypothetical protein
VKAGYTLCVLDDSVRVLKTQLLNTHNQTRASGSVSVYVVPVCKTFSSIFSRLKRVVLRKQLKRCNRHQNHLIHTMQTVWNILSDMKYIVKFDVFWLKDYAWFSNKEIFRYIPSEDDGYVKQTFNTRFCITSWNYIYIMRIISFGSFFSALSKFKLIRKIYQSWPLFLSLSLSHYSWEWSYQPGTFVLRSDVVKRITEK